MIAFHLATVPQQVWLEEIWALRMWAGMPSSETTAGPQWDIYWLGAPVIVTCQEKEAFAKCQLCLQLCQDMPPTTRSLYHLN